MTTVGWVAAAAPLELYLPTAVAVLEVLSPGDETYAKLDFHDARGVREILVVDPVDHRIGCWSRADTSRPASQPRSQVFEVAVTGPTASIDWP